MKHIWGLSDVIIGEVEDPPRCEQCGATTQLAGGVCVSCLLREGLAADEISSSREFEDVLAEARVPDENWRLGNYEILGEIGRGGMGVIYRARQRHSRRIVAVKRVLTYHANSRETLERFRREAEAVASLDHPNILPIYEVSESEEGLPFFSMKWATGGSFREVGPSLREDTELCVRLMAKVARAVDYAHSQGILHRDLQPGNILLDGRGEPLVSDFGLAKWLGSESDLTRTLTTFGTPGYIAPEQATDAAAALTPAADIYSLGAIFFNLLTNRPPFLGANALSVIRKATEVPAPRLRAIAPSLDRNLETIVGRCLERDPQRRYASAGALAEDLERHLDGRAILARPVRRIARAWHWSKHNRALAAAAAACVALTLVLAWLLFAPQFRPQAASPEKSIAVLPFENLNGDADNLFFTDGMQEDILTDLGRIADLKVISRSSVREYQPDAPRDLRAIAQSLGVRHLLEGSVRRADGRVRINAHLTDAVTGAQVWAEQFDRQLEDVFSIQSEIAQKIAARLQAQLSPREQASIAATPTADLAAYDLYLRAKEIARNVGLSTADRTRSEVALLEQAIARDPKFVAALCTLARAHLELYWYNHEHTPEGLEAARSALEKAAQLQPDAGEVHLTRAIYHYWGYRDYVPAVAELEQARTALPNDADVAYFSALIARRRGDWNASTRYFQHARALDPRDSGILYELARSNLFALKRYRESAEISDSVLSWKPDDFDFQLARAKVDVASRADLTRLRAVMNHALGTAAEQAPAYPFARLELALYDRDYAAAAEALAAFPPGEINEAGYVTPHEFYAGIISRGLGRPNEARSLFLHARELAAANVAKRPDDAKAQIVLAEIDARLGYKEEAIAAGERAVALLPTERDAVDGPILMNRLAAVYGQVGEPARAVDLLQRVVKLPIGTNYGELKLGETWDSLRNEARFQAILAALAPRDK